MQKKSIFISYSHTDHAACKRIASLLEKENFAVWYDRGLVPGEIYRKKIAEVIQETEYFMVLISGSSICSDWVIDEVEFAKKLHKKILPVWIENVDLPVDLDMILQRYHSLFWHLRASDEQFQKNLNSVFSDEVNNTEEEKAVIFNEFSETDNRKIQTFLELEKNGRFSECYQPENACLLGIAYYFGIRCKLNKEKASFYFRVAEYNQNIDGSFFTELMKLEGRESDTWDDPEEEFCRPIILKMHDLAAKGSLYAKMYLANYY